MTWLLVISAIVTGVVFSAFFSGAETGIYCVSKLRLDLATRRVDRRGGRTAE